MQGRHFTPLSHVPVWMQPAGEKRLHLATHIIPDKKAKPSTWSNEFYGGVVYGYAGTNPSNAAPNCTVSAGYVNGLGADTKGNLLVPQGYPSELDVYKGCGTLVGSITDSTGQAAAAASISAATGTVLIGDIVGGSGTGDIQVCTLSGGCTATLTNPSASGYGAGVALAKNGDCWLSAEAASFSGFVLVYFKGCSGSGTVATGTSQSYYGGLFLDKKGNLGSFDLSGSLVVYKGCNPACHVLSTTPMQGEVLFGNLNAKGKVLTVGDISTGAVDVYKYSPSGSTYQYSFNNGLNASLDVESGIQTPSNKP
ncbi:MAG TPA: hypothetical protein VMU38_01090 [Candidatus Binatia bacterium]|nr:hypothetical protein [Candidatus Binatia bacterium]